MRKLAIVPMVLGSLPAFNSLTVQSAVPGEIAVYSAEYEVEYKGRHVANAEFSVRKDSTGQFIFNSTTQARGVWRLASPKPAIEWSQFRLNGNGIVPISFRYEDGSRKGEDNYTLLFDAASGTVEISGPNGASSLPFDAGLLDRGSLQVALMHDLNSCELPGPYRYVDDDGVTEYEYQRLEDASAATEIGTLDTIRFSQHREGSSRRTVLWLAADLSYLPVRMEQIRDGEIETVFAIQSLTGLERQTSGCSGFR